MKLPPAHVTLLSTLVILGAGLRLWGIGFGLPHPMTRPDEEFIVSMALRFFSGDYNPHFFEWPSLYFYIVHGIFRGVCAIGYLTGTYASVDAFTRATAADPSWAHVVLRLMSASAGVATLLVIYSFAKSLFDRTTALVAAWLLAVAYLHVRDSHFGVLDVPLTLLTLVSVGFLVQAWIGRRPMLFFALAGAVAGLASSVKYNAAALVVPGLVAGVLRVGESQVGERQRAFMSLSGFLVMFVVCFLAGSPYVLLDIQGFREGLDAQVVRLTEGHGIAIYHVWRRHLTFSLWHGVGGPALAAAIVGAVVLGLRDWRKALLVGAFPVSYFLVIGHGQTAFIRYTTPLIPFICVFAAFGVRAIVERAAPLVSARARPYLAAALVMGVALQPLVSSVRFDRLLTECDTRLLAADWLASHVKPGDSLFESGASYARPLYAWPASRPRFAPVTFEARRAVFLTDGGAVVQPDWIVLAESPLRLYTPVPPELRSILSGQYRLVETFRPAREPEPEASFDRQDAFFLPYADFSARERPGPQLSIYRRESLGAHD